MPKNPINTGFRLQRSPNYEVVVYLENKNNLTEILQLSHSLSDDFEAQGLPIAISTRKAS